MTQVLSPTPEALALASQLLHDGQLVAFPTETVYGLGANALDAKAVLNIFAAKGRPADNPLIVHVYDRAQLTPLCEVSPLAENLMDAFWPGPLTLILPRKSAIPDEVAASLPTVAVRMPSHPVAAAQIEFISPAEFIPILEESGLIIPAGRWILRQAVACCKKWQEFIPEFKVNVNLSYVQIIKSKILDEIKHALKAFNLKPALLGIEVTESGYLENTYHYKKLWSSLKEEGITLILDDYGTGYSNAYRLSDLTPHYIKIDRVLTQKALSSNYERSILIYIIEMAHSLKLNVCIEGVETEEELQEIKKLNPDYIQGYLFGKPAPEDEFYNRQIKKK